MSFELNLTVLVLFAAVLHAGWNALLKVGRDRLLSITVVMAVGSVVAAPLLPFLPIPAAESRPYLALSVLVHVGYFFFLLQAYRVGDLSHVYPIARGSAPLLVAVGAAVFAGEGLDPLALSGLVLASAAISGLAFAGDGPGRDWRPLLFALGTAGFIAVYTVVDGLGVRRSGSPLSYIAWLMFFDSFALVIYVLVRRPGELVPYVRAHWIPCGAGGIMCLLAYGLVIYALNFGGMAYISALRETSIIFAALIGTMVLGESFGIRRIIAAVIMAGGLMIMSLSG